MSWPVFVINMANNTARIEDSTAELEGGGKASFLNHCATGGAYVA